MLHTLQLTKKNIMKKELQMYFRSIDDCFCNTLEDILEDAKIEGLTEITVIEAIPDNGTTDMIWCTYHGECLDRGECKKSICRQYESTSGRGVCQHRGKLYLHGEEKTFVLNKSEKQTYIHNCKLNNYGDEEKKCVKCGYVTWVSNKTDSEIIEDMIKSGYELPDCSSSC